jgi:hypothetical protein
MMDADYFCPGCAKDLLECTCTKSCYQCLKTVAWLASDGRCKDCTGLTPEEVA